MSAKSANSAILESVDPLIVISNGLWKPLSEIPGISSDENRQAMKSELLELSSNSKQIIADHSEHFIQLQQPQLVVDTVREIVQTTQKAAK